MHQSGGFTFLLRALFPLFSFNSNKFSLTVFKFMIQICSLLSLCLNGGADPVRERHVRALLGHVLRTGVLRKLVLPGLGPLWTINPPHLVTVWSPLIAFAAHEEDSTLL